MYIVNNINLAIYYCHPGARQTTQKLVHFYMLIKSSWEICEKKKVYGEKHSFIELT